MSDDIRDANTEEPDLVDLAALVPEPYTIHFRIGSEEYAVRHPLDLTLVEASQTERSARVINQTATKLKEGKYISPKELGEYEASMSEYCEVVSTVPGDILRTLKWYQKLVILKIFQTQRSSSRSPDEAVEGDESPVNFPEAETVSITDA